MTIAREPHLGTGDAELLERVRDGDLDAYGVLWERHHEAALGLARQMSRSTADADDLVADAFSRVLTAIGNGNGPTEAFRPYLLTAVRRRAYDRTSRAAHEELVEDPGTDATFAEMVHELETDDGVDQALATTAFLTLPERWQTVLWHTEVEESSPGEVGELLGINANATSVLAHRAREGLRQAYLQAHLAQAGVEEACGDTIEKLGSFVRGGLAKRAVAKVEHHLHDCARCRTLRDELADLNTTLRRTVAPAVLGPAAVGYLALQRGGEGAAAATAAGSTASTASTASTGKLVALVAATVAVFTLVATSAVPSDASKGEPPEPEVTELAAAATDATGGASGLLADGSRDDGTDLDDTEPVEAALPDGVVPVELAPGLCQTTMQAGDGAATVAADDGGDVTGAALLWNDEGSVVTGLDLPATTTLVTDALDGVLANTFAFVTDVTDVVASGACGVGSVLTQLPEEGVVQWVLVLTVDTAVDVLRAAVDLVEGVVDEVDVLVDGLVGLSVADTAAGGALADVLDTVDQTLAALPPTVTGLLEGELVAPGSGGAGATSPGGSPGGGGGGGPGGRGGGGGAVERGGTPPPAPPPTNTPTTQPGLLDPVTDPLLGNPNTGQCGLLQALLGLC